MKIIKKSSIIAVISALAALQTTTAAENTASVNLLKNAEIKVSVTKKGESSPWKENVRFKSDGKHKVRWQAAFSIDNPANYVSLSLDKPKDITAISLNGKPVKVPIEGMSYSTIPGIPVSMLKKGTNLLQASWSTTVKNVKNKKTARMSCSPNSVSADSTKFTLHGQNATALKFQTGPVLGYAGRDFFTVSCRINIPAKVVLHVNKHNYVSEPALLHNFMVEGLKTGTKYNYTLTAEISGNSEAASVGPYTVQTLPKKVPFKFAVLGDSRTHPHDWKKVADATVKAEPAFSLFVGDMVTNGRIDKMWDDEFCSPAADYLATIPFFSVIGNHEGNCPLFPKLFQSPPENGTKNWSQQIGPVLIIGIDGEMNWSRDGKLAKWLESTLAKSKADYIFLGSHFPAWTSGGHGVLKNGRPRERTIKQGQDVIMPLLKKYNATAMFAGHDHFYERSEPEGGVTVFVTGGAGAPLRDKAKNAAKQNPYSKAFEKRLHYCLVTVGEESCTLEALTPEGEVLDTRTWKPRK